MNTKLVFSKKTISLLNSSQAYVFGGGASGDACNSVWPYNCVSDNCPSDPNDPTTGAPGGGGTGNHGGGGGGFSTPCNGGGTVTNGTFKLTCHLTRTNN